MPLLELDVHKMIVTKASAQTGPSWAADKTGWVVASIKGGKGAATAWLALLHPRTYRFLHLRPHRNKTPPTFFQITLPGTSGET